MKSYKSTYRCIVCQVKIFWSKHKNRLDLFDFCLLLSDWSDFPPLCWSGKYWTAFDIACPSPALHTHLHEHKSAFCSWPSDKHRALTDSFGLHCLTSPSDFVRNRCWVSSSSWCAVQLTCLLIDSCLATLLDETDLLRCFFVGNGSIVMIWRVLAFFNDCDAVTNRGLLVLSVFTDAFSVIFFTGSSAIFATGPSGLCTSTIGDVVCLHWKAVWAP